MPSIKCQACGHRHFQPVLRCINCGAPLAASTSATSPQGEQDTFSEQPIAMPGQEAVANSIASTTETIQEKRGKHVPRSSAALTPHDATVEEQTPPGRVDPSRQLVVKKTQEVQAANNQRWKKQTALQEYEPYETAIDVAMQDPFTAAPLGTVAIREEPQAIDNPELWKHDRLPFFFPRTTPALSGKVVHMESKEEIIDYPDLFAAVATILVELLWVMVDVQQEKDNDRVVMTTLRVQTYDRGLKDARIRGNMRGADLSLGDEVSLWGRRRHGIIYVRHGFNHTTKGVVHTASMGLIIPAILIILVFIGGIYFAPTWIPVVGHIFGNSLGPLFSFFKQHPLHVPIQKK